MSASAVAAAAPHLRWTEEPCDHVGAVDLTLHVDGSYFGMVCTSTERVGRWDGWMRCVVGMRKEAHFKTREECVAFMEISAHGLVRGTA